MPQPTQNFVDECNVGEFNRYHFIFTSIRTIETGGVILTTKIDLGQFEVEFAKVMKMSVRSPLHASGAQYRKRSK